MQRHDGVVRRAWILLQMELVRPVLKRHGVLFARGHVVLEGAKHWRANFEGDLLWRSGLLFRQQHCLILRGHGLLRKSGLVLGHGRLRRHYLTLQTQHLRVVDREGQEVAVGQTEPAITAVDASHGASPRSPAPLVEADGPLLGDPVPNATASRAQFAVIEEVFRREIRSVRDVGFRKVPERIRLVGQMSIHPLDWHVAMSMREQHELVARINRQKPRPFNGPWCAIGRKRMHRIGKHRRRTTRWLPVLHALALGLQRVVRGHILPICVIRRGHRCEGSLRGQSVVRRDDRDAPDEHRQVQPGVGDHQPAVAERLTSDRRPPHRVGAFVEVIQGSAVAMPHALGRRFQPDVVEEVLALDLVLHQRLRRRHLHRRLAHHDLHAVDMCRKVEAGGRDADPAVPQVDALDDRAPK
mmetsp:Transcript_101141/g.271677  ORF Transcript_101141/g.271677 Transcript_101141/m.271677 type:complete len:412 (+) Transcript_101141:1048-2283(+)